MDITTEQYKKIIRFLDAGMDAAEMDAFEKELADNPEMRAQLDFEQSLRDNFALQNITNLPATESANETVAGRTVPGKIRGMQKWFAIVAAVITAIMLVAIFWQNPETKPNAANKNIIDTAQQTTKPPPLVVATQSKDSSAGIDLALLFKQYFKKAALPEQYPLYLAEAFTNYESGNYTTLQQLDLSNLPQTRSINESDSKENILLLGHYYKGQAFLQTNNTKQAIINLHWVLNNQPDKALRAKAQWYLALAYLKENNKEKAIELCRSITNNKGNDVLVKNAKKILDIIGK